MHPPLHSSVEKSTPAGVTALAAVERKKRGNLGGVSLREELHGKRFLRADFAAIDNIKKPASTLGAD